MILPSTTVRKKTIRIEPRSIIIVEGILVLADKRLRDLFDIKIYVETDADERILRRVMRDFEGTRTGYRKYSRPVPERRVKPMHYLFVEPSRAKADFVINGGMNPVALDLVVTKIRDRLSQQQKGTEI